MLPATPADRLSVTLMDDGRLVIRLWRTEGGVVLLRLESDENVSDHWPTSKVYRDEDLRLVMMEEQARAIAPGVAARMVLALAEMDGRALEELAAADAFLSQWGEGGRSCRRSFGAGSWPPWRPRREAGRRWGRIES